MKPITGITDVERALRAMIAFFLCIGTVSSVSAASGDAASGGEFKRGESIYTMQCAECHGARGEGVADRYDEALFGNRSIDSLAGLITRTMPEEDPDLCVGEDAQAVAIYIYHAFYSLEARARLNPVRIDPARLTNRQYQESAADLVASFLPVKWVAESGGLAAEYYTSQGMNRKDKKVFDRTDEVVDFDFGTGTPFTGMAVQDFAIAWNGSILAPDTGEYQFRITTPNGARLYLNANLEAGDSNRRDDSSARRVTPTIDLWVSQGGEMREATTSAFLLGGRSYPVRLDYFRFKDATASVRFEWKPPHGDWEIVPSTVLAPEVSSPSVAVSTPFPADDRSVGYERGTAVSKAWLEATTRAAIEVATAVESRVGVLSGVRDRATNRVELLAEFCTKFAERAFRRPIDDATRSLVVNRFFDGSLAPEAAVKRSVIAILTSPRFLYPGLGDPADGYSVASRLALSLWDSVPDNTLLEAAKKGELESTEQVRAHAERMMMDGRARSKLNAFFREWLLVEEADDISKDAAAFPGYDPSMVADLRTSLDHFVEHVVWGEASDYRELLQADYVFLNERLAEFYGVQGIEGDEFLRKRFDPEERVGIFTHPLLLSTLAYHRSTSPIHRGVFLTRNVMGRFLKPPPMAIEFMDDRFDPTLTMREKVAELTRQDTCMACHVTINPLGFALERYDAMGRVQFFDNGKPVDTESEYLTADGELLKIRGARDLAQHAVDSVDAHRGFVRHLFQHTVKQAPGAYGSDALDRLVDHFAKRNFHIRDLMTEIAIQSALHPVRKQQQQQQASR